MKLKFSPYALVAILGILCSILSGCSNIPASSQVYSTDQALRVGAAQEGAVVRTRPIQIQSAMQTGAGYAMGGTVGAAAGALVSDSRARWLLGALGGSIGALAGNAIERAAATTPGLEIVVKLDDGQIQVISQAADVPIAPGQRVMVVGQQGNVRVAPI